ncbi:CDP-alcohol phosphatidyltransferase family protein [Agrococcus sp. HG114]|uniref:CDP-alcohol phosphatidyltransferase family protein n=1 Tax=Agrococcus sp. HG114 TaxID=2969757 RepID=UPI00215AD55C|nr:CDP-alcohol phosphatidyltransferase family protein [Agrococcus sp. HG114]MCR8670989.1 CDP-alcohol phosphatidyltransferase family protein [Agrococcus sp. HG114]
MTESFSEVHRRLASAQKGHARGAPAYSVYVNRRLGRVLAVAAHRAGWTPNTVTAVSAAHTAVGIALLLVLPVAWWSGVVVALLLALGYAWDSADGQVARLRGGGTLAGEWLDHFVDAIKLAVLHLAVLLALWLHTPLRGSAWLLVPLLFSVVGVVTFFAMLLNDLLKGKVGVPSTHERGSGTPLRSLLLVPTDYGVLCLVFALWGSTTGFLVAYGALALANLLFLVLAATKWFREMQAIDRARAAR